MVNLQTQDKTCTGSQGKYKKVCHPGKVFCDRQAGTQTCMGDILQAVLA